MLDDPEKIADGLTEAQRRCVLKLSQAAQLPGLATFNANAAFNLIRKGVTKMGFDPKRRRESFCLTPLGLTVRHLLESEARHD